MLIKFTMFVKGNAIKHEIRPPFVIHLFSNKVSKLDNKKAFKIVLIGLMFINYKQHMQA